MCVCVWGRTRIQEQGQVRQGQCQKNRPRKALTASPRESINNSPQARRDCNARGP